MIPLYCSDTAVLDCELEGDCITMGTWDKAFPIGYSPNVLYYKTHHHQARDGGNCSLTHLEGIILGKGCFWPFRFCAKKTVALLNPITIFWFSICLEGQYKDLAITTDSNEASQTSIAIKELHWLLILYCLLTQITPHATVTCQSLF